ncbi:malate synthase A, partial [Kocuria sp. CPCC 205300]
MTPTSTVEHTVPEGLDRAGEILTDGALQFVAELHRRFAPRRAELLGLREEHRRRAASTGSLDFLPETREIRESEWTVAP